MPDHPAQPGRAPEPETPPAASDPDRPTEAAGHPVYAELHASKDFAELRRRFRGFVVPWTVAFLAWYLLYVVLSNWAPDLMGTRVVGHVNLALVLGLLQFVSTFAIAFLYSRYAARHLDPPARRMEQRFDEEVGR